MTVTYNIVRRHNPRAPLEPKKYYPSIQSSGRVTTRELAEMAAQRSTLSTMDMMAAMESLLAIIPEQLARGNIVELGDFGSFWLRAQTAGVETEEETETAQIERLKALFRPGWKFKTLLREVQFVRRRLPPAVPPPPEP